MSYISNDKGIALVLDGGGGKGAYFVGVWQAMREIGFDQKIAAVSGASVGALNAVLFANGDFETAKNIWMDQVDERIIPRFYIPILNLMRQVGVWWEASQTGYINMTEVELIQNSNKTFFDSHFKLFGSERIDEILCNEDNNISFDTIRYSRMPIYVSVSKAQIQRWGPSWISDKIFNVASSTTKEDVRYIKLNGKSDEEIKKAIFASSAFPFVFKAQEINGEKVRDGGIHDNTPIKPLYDEGYRRFLVVHLNKVTNNSSSFVKNHSEFLDASIIELFPSVQGKTLTFSKQQSEMLYEAGLEDMRKYMVNYQNYDAVISASEASLNNVEKALSLLESGTPYISQKDLDFIKLIDSILDD